MINMKKNSSIVNTRMICMKWIWKSIKVGQQTLDVIYEYLPCYQGKWMYWTFLEQLQIQFLCINNCFKDNHKLKIEQINVFTHFKSAIKEKEQKTAKSFWWEINPLKAFIQLNCEMPFVL